MRKRRTADPPDFSAIDEALDDAGEPVGFGFDALRPERDDGLSPERVASLEAEWEAETRAALASEFPDNPDRAEAEFWKLRHELAAAALDAIPREDAIATTEHEWALFKATETTKAAERTRESEARRAQTAEATIASVKTRTEKSARWKTLIFAEAEKIRGAWEAAGRTHTYGESESTMATVIRAKLPKRLDGTEPGVADGRPQPRTIRAWLAEARRKRSRT